MHREGSRPLVSLTPSRPPAVIRKCGSSICWVDERSLVLLTSSKVECVDEQRVRESFICQTTGFRIFWSTLKNTRAHEMNLRVRGGGDLFVQPSCAFILGVLCSAAEKIKTQLQWKLSGFFSLSLPPHTRYTHRKLHLQTDIKPAVVSTHMHSRSKLNVSARSWPLPHLQGWAETIHRVKSIL